MAIQRIIQYFLRGLLLVVPASATIYIIFITISWVDGLLPISIPGVGLVSVFIITVLIGMLADSILAQPIFRLIEGVIKKVPVVNFIYTSFNDVIGAVAGKKKKFNHPVLVPFDDNNHLLKPGFVTHDDLSESNLEKYIAVYMPHSYNFSGNIFFIDKSKIMTLEGSNSEIMKYIVSAGVTGNIGIKK